MCLRRIQRGAPGPTYCLVIGAMVGPGRGLPKTRSVNQGLAGFGQAVVHSRSL